MHVAYVAGATGYTGREVVRAAVARGAKTYAHVRPDSPRLAEWRERFGALGAEVDATPWDRDAITKALAAIAPTHVFSLLGTTRARAKTAAPGVAADYEAIDFGLTMLLLEAVLASGTKARFIYLSAAGVSAGASTPYLQVRWRAERRVTESGLSFAIARPSFITGPDRDEDRPVERIAAKVADGALALAGVLGGRKIRDRYRSTDAATLALALARLGFDRTDSRVFESEDLR